MSTLAPEPAEGERLMLDFIILALGFALFALTFGYAIACDRL